jgi:hypothetical protein
MAARLRHDHAWINILFRVVFFQFVIATYLIGTITLIFGTLLSAQYLIYRWLRDGVWHAYSLAEVLADGSEPDRPIQSGGWLFEAPLLIALPTVGGTLTVASLALFFGAGLFLIGTGRQQATRAALIVQDAYAGPHRNAAEGIAASLPSVPKFN